MSRTIRASLALLALFLFQHAFATNGYVAHGLGTKNKGLAGAGIATPKEAIASANNPASAVVMDSRFEVGVSLFSPRRGFDASQSSANGAGGAFTVDRGVTSDHNYFVIPYVAWNWKRNDENALAVALYGRGGMNTEYNGGSATFDPDGPGPAPVMTSPGVFGAGDLGVDFAQLFFDLTYAHRAGSFAWGVSAVLTAHSIDLDGVTTFAPYTRAFASSGGTELPRHLSNSGREIATGLGYKLGLLWTASDTVRLALSYQSEVQMSKFGEYSDLFAQRGGFNIPQSFKTGVSWDSTDRLTLHLDVERTYFSDIDSVGTPTSVLFGCPTAGAGGTEVENCLGGRRGAGFGWHDMTTTKFGVTYRPAALEGWELRGGLSHGEQPVQPGDVLFNIIAPGVIENHVTVGATTHIGDRELSFSLMYAPENSVSGKNPFDPTQRITLEMHQFELEFALAW